jgi:hypothetical protein
MTLENGKVIMRACKDADRGHKHHRAKERARAREGGREGASEQGREREREREREEETERKREQARERDRERREDRGTGHRNRGCGPAQISLYFSYSPDCPPQAREPPARSSTDSAADHIPKDLKGRESWRVNGRLEPSMHHISTHDPAHVPQYSAHPCVMHGACVFG